MFVFWLLGWLLMEGAILVLPSLQFLIFLGWSGGSSHEDSKGNDNNSSDAQPATTQAVTQELDVVPKTGEDITAYVMEIMLLFGGILLITMGILLQRKHG